MKIMDFPRSAPNPMYLYKHCWTIAIRVMSVRSGQPVLSSCSSSRRRSTFSTNQKLPISKIRSISNISAYLWWNLHRYSAAARSNSRWVAWTGNSYFLKICKTVAISVRWWCLNPPLIRNRINWALIYWWKWLHWNHRNGSQLKMLYGISFLIRWERNIFSRRRKGNGMWNNMSEGGWNPINRYKDRRISNNPCWTITEVFRLTRVNPSSPAVFPKLQIKNMIKTPPAVLAKTQ
jgi:hypothetical protein